MSQTSEIKEFFRKYSQAYLAFDPVALISFFHYPCLIHDLSGVHLLTNETDAIKYEQKFLENLKQLEITKIEYELFHHDFSKTLPNAKECKLSYKLFNKNNVLLIDFDYYYSLIKNENWLILFARLGDVRKY